MSSCRVAPLLLVVGLQRLPPTRPPVVDIKKVHYFSTPARRWWMAADHGIIPDRADLMHIDMGNGLRTHSESVSGSPHGRGVPEAAAGVIMKWLCSGSPGRSCAELRYVGEAASIASCTYGHGGARTAPGMLREKRDVPERTTEEAPCERCHMVRYRCAYPTVLGPLADPFL